MGDKIEVLCIKFILLIFSINFIGCATLKEKQEKDIMKYVRNNFKNIDPWKESCIFIISENGCMNCNREMSRVARQFIDMNDIYFIINANAGGRIVDISPYWEAKNQEQISFDTLDYFNNHNLKSSYAVFINDDAIDTILEATADKFYDKAHYIENRIIESRK
ncbi:MAG: hypothetical protein ACTTJH_01575 [Bacteroidales bacterium]